MYILAAVTRLQAQQTIPPSAESPPVAVDDVTQPPSDEFAPPATLSDTPVTTHSQPLAPGAADISEEIHSMFNLHDSLFSHAGPDKPILTCAQKRAQNRRYHSDHSDPIVTSTLDIEADELRT